MRTSRRTFLGAAAAAVLHGARRERMNVLFIAVDDLRPELGCYGSAIVRSPHIDELAAGGVTFTRAYCQIAVCSPSRTSLLTGLRPDTTGIYDLTTHFRRNLPDAVTLPEQFRKNGFETTAFSKIFHLSDHTPGGLDDPPSWSIPSWHPYGPEWNTRENQALARRLSKELEENGWSFHIQLAGVHPGKPGRVWDVPSWEAPDVDDSELVDGMTTDRAIEGMKHLRDRPFFLGVGYRKPHLPFVAPKRYFDLYRRERIPLPSNPYPPEGAPPPALHDFTELRQYSDMPWKGALNEEQARDLIRAYYACVSYVDAQVGRLLAALRRLDLERNTVVILWGDHGFHLGDHRLWCKHSNFENATRSPLIIRAPGVGRAGVKISALTEFVDIYPSLCDLCGISVPEGLEGVSFRPLLENPRQEWKSAAFSQFPRAVAGVGQGMGRSIRTERFRYTEWRVPATGFLARELYDHRNDPEENRNAVNDPVHSRTVQELSRRLAAGWKHALPLAVTRSGGRVPGQCTLQRSPL